MINPAVTIKMEPDYDSWFFTYEDMLSGVSSCTMPVLYPLQVRNLYRPIMVILGSYFSWRFTDGYDYKLDGDWK